ncbi:MAG: homogentisate 1,2-dioxygenase [Alphaproteobacteria bacterium]|nr:homogentisate 1,2-dioxygenase [Alphaproteobacteria bacterium]MDE2110414.1 homogentisate 1,2-dioxygenase [Alphaproteobacteria bacterium]MDE2493427.1 homogentisate 1,2-dioxygenase [Alphaproteobacteria bacterium]
MSARNWIELPRIEGEASRQAHTDLPCGTFEREIGRDGFFGPASHLYHRHPPTGWTSFEGPLRPRAFDAEAAAQASSSPFIATTLLSNTGVKLRIWACERAMPVLARNADGDELLFIHSGEGELFCDFGHLSYREGDYILLPRGTMWRLEPAARTVALLIEATNGAYKLPERGPLGPHAVFDPAVLDTPKLDDCFHAQAGEREWRVEVKRRDVISTITYPFNPLDAVGWKGNLSTLRLNWRDIRPVMSHRYHIPPSVHATFAADRFVVCTFVPRPIESDPGALKVPFFHSNDDYDEVIFYHAGKFFSRDNIRPGMITWHPNGFPHGPHPKAFAAGIKAAKTMTDEVAVMIDTRDPLDMSDAAGDVEDRSYTDSWKAR